MSLVYQGVQLRQHVSQKPPSVMNFVEFHAAREEGAAAGAGLGESLAKLHALNLPPPSDEKNRSGDSGGAARSRGTAYLIVRIVLDTNTLVSGVVAPAGPARCLIDNARAQALELCRRATLRGRVA